MKRHVTLALLLIAVAVGGGVAVAEEVTDIGTDHDLDSETAIKEYQNTGYVEGETDRYQVTLAVADERAEVGAGDAVASDIRNTYLRINYQEDHGRTLRILLPRDYITPYTTEQDSLTTNHTVNLEPARSGEYIAATVNVTGQADIVIPLNKDHAISYGVLEQLDQRVEKLTGVSPLDREYNWQYIESEELGANTTMKLNYTSDEIVVQFDATPDAATETWLNAPNSETESAPVYYFERKADEGVHIVVTEEEAPAVRYRTKGTLGAQVRGWVNEALSIPQDFVSSLEDYIPWGGG